MTSITFDFFVRDCHRPLIAAWAGLFLSMVTAYAGDIPAAQDKKREQVDRSTARQNGLPRPSARGADSRKERELQRVLTVSVRLGGAPRSERQFTFEALSRLPQHGFKTGTPWRAEEIHFSGPRLRDVLEAAGMPPQANARIKAFGLDDYEISIPIEDAYRTDVIVAIHKNNQPISVANKGPYRIVYPYMTHPQFRKQRYVARSVRHLVRIELE